MGEIDRSWYKYGRHSGDCMKYSHNWTVQAVGLSQTILMKLDSVKSLLQINHLDVIIYLESQLQPKAGLVPTLDSSPVSPNFNQNKWAKQLYLNLCQSPSQIILLVLQILR